MVCLSRCSLWYYRVEHREGMCRLEFTVCVCVRVCVCACVDVCMVMGWLKEECARGSRVPYMIQTQAMDSLCTETAHHDCPLLGAVMCRDLWPVCMYAVMNITSCHATLVTSFLQCIPMYIWRPSHVLHWPPWHGVCMVQDCFTLHQQPTRSLPFRLV